MIEIDGSQGEGGGQMIRTSLSLSAITGKAVKIRGIRAGRPNPGLAAQHLTAAKSVRKVCRGALEGAEIGSKGLVFEPGKIVGGIYDIDIGTAGSATLVAQTLIPILLHAEKPSILRITGGTHVMKSPGYDYLQEVFFPAINKFGAGVEGELIKPGFYPKGGGQINIRIKPGPLWGCGSWRKEDYIRAIIRVCGLDKSIAIREKKIFVQRGIEHVFIREDASLSVGNSITAWKGFRGAYVLGERGKRAEIVAQEALEALDCEQEQVDRHLADQLLIYAALSEGESSYSTSVETAHLLTNRDVISRFLDREIEIESGRVSVR